MARRYGSVMDWTTACPDWEERILAKRSLIPFPPLFPREADECLDVFKQLRVADVQGGPPMGEICRPWILDFVSAIFGAYDAEAGRRLITEFLLLISKKNSKSTTAAGIMMTALIRNWRESAEFLILAPTIEIANNSFFPARDMVRRDEDLSALMHVQEHYRTITNRITGATLKVVAADNESVGGKKATGVLVDELWLFGKRTNAENMLREATGGLASRPEGFTIYLSTQSDEPPAGVFLQKLLYARGVRDGSIDDKRFLPVLYEYPDKMIEEERFREREFFYVTNPNLGASVDPEFLERKLREAELGGTADDSVQGIFSKHFNVEIGVRLGSKAFAGAAFWPRQAREGLDTLDDLIARSDVMTLGIDGGGLDDLLGFTAVGREIGTGNLLTWSKAWAHKIVLERRKQIAPQLLDLAKDGDLTIVENIGEDISELADLVEQVYLSGLLNREDDEEDKMKPAIGVDPAGIGSILDAIASRKVPMGKVIGITQGWRMTGAVKTTERRLAEGTLWHGGKKLMAWCIGNARVEPRGNAIIITKQTSGTAKIDPLMALFNAMELMSRVPEASGASFWEKPAPAAA
jgi:phage terminase large subunit-like protein